jgi:hypothetical protein
MSLKKRMRVEYNEGLSAGISGRISCARRDEFEGMAYTAGVHVGQRELRQYEDAYRKAIDAGRVPPVPPNHARR